MNRPSIRWPITTIDFEATSLASNSHPIEIGVASWEGPGSIATVWSRLIRPTPGWDARGSWNPASEAIHGISRSSLDEGHDPTDVMRTLNERCPMGVLAFCDGGRYDGHWLAELAAAAAIEPLLHLGSWHRLARMFDEEGAARLATHRAPHEIAHRAGPDAMDHIRALSWALDEPEPTFVDLDA